MISLSGYSQSYKISREDSLKGVELHKAGVNSGRIGDYEDALSNFYKLIQLREKNYGSKSSRLAPPLVNLGIQYKNLGNFDKAVEAYKNAEALCNPTDVNDNYVLAIIYTNLGVVFRQIGDYNQALLYQKNSYQILFKDSLKYFSNFEVSKYNIAELQLKLGYNKEAIQFALANVKSTSPELKPLLYDLIALGYKNEGKIELSEKYYLLAIQSWIELYGDNNVELISQYLSYSSFLISQKNYDKALLYSKKAKSIVLNFYSEKSINYADVESSLGDYYYMKNSEARQIDDFRIQRKKDLKEAIQYYQNSIVALTDSFKIHDPFVDPPLKNIISEIQLVEQLKRKALAMEKLADIYLSEFDFKNSYKYFHASLSSLTNAIELIHRLQIGFENEDSKYFLAQNQQSTFSDAIKISYKLYKQSKKVEFIERAFEFSERSKSSNLLASVKELKAKEFGGIPDSLLNREKYLKSNIANYTSMLIAENHSKNPEIQKVNLYQSKIFKYNEEYNKLIDSFEQKYPTYYAFKYENKVIGIKEIQSKLSSRQAIVEYYTNEPSGSLENGELYRFVITRDSLHLSFESLGYDYVQDIQTVFNFLTNPNYLYTKRKDYVAYSIAGYSLYNKLLEPIASTVRSKDITLIPHDKLSYIPFDALLSALPDTSSMNFRNLNYVIRDFTINYSYSATLLYHFYKRNTSNSKNILAFAPEYSQQYPRKDPENLNMHYLSPLAGAANEVDLISKHMKSESYSGVSAQETSFKKKASQFSILHLAMHTIINDSLPMFSKLVFSVPDANSTDDGFLNTYEIYNMQFSAQLAVLSACETGTGKLQKGEGVMSMARGFVYAGCPAIVMTLWQVEDKSGTKIMDDFYNYLSKGKRKDVALRMAKLNHINSSDPLTAHPHYWLGYVSVGNPEPLFTSKDFYFVILILLVILMFVAHWYIRKKSNRGTSRREAF